MKIKWVEYLKNNPADWFYMNMKEANSNNIWNANLEEKDVKYIIEEKGFNIAGTVLKALARINFEVPTNDFPKQLIWGNSLIRQAGKPIYNKLTQSNLDRVYQLFHEEQRRFLTYEEYYEQYGAELNILDFNGIKAAIPAVWRQDIIEQKNYMCDLDLDSPTRFQKIEGKITKAMYWELIEKKQKKDSSRLNWEKDLSIAINEDQWIQLFPMIMKATNCDKLRTFQYKILNRALVTNYIRNKWDPEVDVNCVFCKTQTETIRHILCECKQVNRLWKALEKWKKYYIGITVVLTDERIILNNYQGKCSQIINTLILCLKRYIYVSKCKEESVLNFQSYMTSIFQLKRVERLIATRNNPMKIFYKKWNNVI